MGGSKATNAPLRRAAITCAAFTVAIVAGLPIAQASNCLNVRTVSGKIFCKVGTDSVVCSAGNAGGFQDGPQPRIEFLASVTPDGNFQWIRAGGLGSCGNRAQVLDYGVTQTINNWVIQPDTSGTRFSYSNTGRGMFVSVGNVYWF